MGSEGDAPRLSGSRVRRRRHGDHDPVKRQRLPLAEDCADLLAVDRPSPVGLSNSTSSSAMSITQRDENDGDVVVGESCCSPRDDIDMNTPTTAILKAAQDWRLAQPDCVLERVDGKHKGDIGPSARSHFTQDEGITSQYIKDEQLMAFREYNDSDIDSLEISPSQDFDGGPHRSTRAESGGEEPATHTSCPWVSFQDGSFFVRMQYRPNLRAWKCTGTQFHDEEASEVFDDVIYAPPKPAPPSRSSESPSNRNTTGAGYDSSSELSDEFDVGAAAGSEAIPNAAHKEPSSRSDWHARMSVKRDCSFVDCTTRPRRRRVCVEKLSESSEEFEEKLRLEDADEDQQDDEAALTADTASSSPGVYSPPSSTLYPSKTGPGSAVLDTGFRPRKKRRKVRQLALDAFLQAPPGASL